MKSFFRKAPQVSVTLEQKLEVLARCGFHLQPPFTADDLIASWTRAEFEKPGFEFLLAALGNPEEQPPCRNFCVNLWHFDTECIEGNGSYVRIAERMREMADGSLPIDNIHDEVDESDGIAFLKFNLRGQAIHIDCKVKEDWVDEKVFSRFADLLAESDANKLYLYYDLRGQDCLIACATKAQYAQLQAAGIAFLPLH